MHSSEQRRIIRLFGLIILMFLLLIGWQSYLQLYKSDWLLAQPTNRRFARAEVNTPRGKILDRNNVPLAWSEKGIRKYKDPVATAAVLGYIDPRYDRVGIEGAWNAELTGLSQRFDSHELLRIVHGEKPRGKDIVLTLDLKLQQAARKALGNQRGAVVMIDPATGGILALATSPTFDASKIGEEYPSLIERTDGVLRNRATQDLYPPGSTMKVVTAAAALMHDVDPGTRYTCIGVTPLDGTKITDYHGEKHGTIDMPRALAHSCNYYFARTAFELGQDNFFATGAGFGFNDRWWTRLPDPRMFPLEITESSLESDLNHRLYTGEFVQMGFGQGTVVATPLQMSMVGAAIANDGILMAPYFVHQVRKGGEKTPLVSFNSVQLGQPMDEGHAKELAAMMRLVVTSGTARGRLNIPGLIVYGKTGTAQQNGGEDHAWFMGFAAKNNDPSDRVAFAVVLERAGRTGGAAAAPIANQMLRAWNNSQE